MKNGIGTSVKEYEAMGTRAPTYEESQARLMSMQVRQMERDLAPASQINNTPLLAMVFCSLVINWVTMTMVWLLLLR